MTELSRISDTGKLEEALWLADRLTWFADPTELERQAAAELRRLHAENAELTRALEISGKANRALVGEVRGNQSKGGEVIHG